MSTKIQKIIKSLKDIRNADAVMITERIVRINFKDYLK